MMEFKLIEYDSDEYRAMVDLRYEILRKPINSVPTADEMAKDKEYILLGAFHPNGGDIVGCCFLTHLTEATVQLRQMAIAEHWQNKGLGAELIDYAESEARKHNYKYMYLHARKVAIGFYKKQGYTIEGDEFVEVGIPHFEMLKNIEQV